MLCSLSRPNMLMSFAGCARVVFPFASEYANELRRLRARCAPCVLFSRARVRSDHALGLDPILRVSCYTVAILGTWFSCHSVLSFIKFVIPFSLIWTASEICRIMVSWR